MGEFQTKESEQQKLENPDSGLDSFKAKAGKYLTFFLDSENYGLDILKVQEIIGIMKITRVPRMPNFVRGVINLRGKIIPVIDLRVKFNMATLEDTEKTCIIVVQIDYKEKQVILGLIVDEVSEVLDIKQDQLEPPPTFSGDNTSNFIMGIGKIEQKVIMLLEVNQVFSEKDVETIEQNS